jgi:hypothetical protein
LLVLNFRISPFATSIQRASLARGALTLHGCKYRRTIVLLLFGFAYATAFFIAQNSFLILDSHFPYLFANLHMQITVFLSLSLGFLSSRRKTLLVSHLN